MEMVRAEPDDVFDMKTDIISNGRVTTAVVTLSWRDGQSWRGGQLIHLGTSVADRLDTPDVGIGIELALGRAFKDLGQALKNDARGEVARRDKLRKIGG